VLEPKECFPTAILFIPVVLLSKVPQPIATLAVPVVLAQSD
jgi:hypothetical protein